MFGKGGWLRRVANLADAAAAEQDIPSPPHVRLARPEDHDQILDLGRDAFRHDPAFLYFVGVKEKEVRDSQCEWFLICRKCVLNLYIGRRMRVK